MTTTSARHSSWTPHWILLFWLLPQAALFIVNGQSHQIIRGDTTPEQNQWMFRLLSGEIALFVTGLGLWIWHTVQQTQAGLRSTGITLAAHVAYLVGALAAIPEILPESVRLWILPEGRVLFHQFAFVMPGALFATLRLAIHPLPLSRGKDMGLSIASFIAVPLGWYVLFVLTIGLFEDDNTPAAILLMVVFVTFTILAIMSLIRLGFLLWSRYQKGGSTRHTALAILLGLVFPLTGLLLNQSIPFPYDFQHPAWYAFALINGVLLVVPRPETPQGQSILWLAQAACFPYVLYFFLVFLPFLPLSLLAMLAFGAGILILAPLALFLFQGAVLREGLKTTSARWGLAPALAACLGAMALIPAMWLGRAQWHRSNLDQAVSWLYESDLSDPQPFSGNPKVVGTALIDMHRSNTGKEIPFLSPMYRELVFDGMILPKNRLEEMTRVFGVSDRVAFEEGEIPFNIMDEWSTGRRGSNIRLSPPPPTDVDLTGVAWNSASTNAIHTLTAHVRMHNQSGRLAEFTTDIELPPGAFISGFELKVGEEWVDGLLFERKAAEWIYRMIRDTSPRDPGLLVFRDADTVNFRVYPILGNEKREARITFLLPEAQTQPVHIGTFQSPPPSEPHAAPSPWLHQSSAGAALWLPENASATWPTVRRNPRLEVLVDRSKLATMSAAQISQRVESFRKQHAPGAPVSLRFAHLEMLPPVQFEAEEAVVLPALPARQEGLPLNNHLPAWMHQCVHDPDPGYYPLLLLLHEQEKDATLYDPKNLAAWKSHFPETGGFWIADKAGSPNKTFFEPAGPRAIQDEVHLLRVGGQTIARPASPGGILHSFPDAKPSERVEAWDPDSKAFVPVANPSAPPEPYNTALKLDLLVQRKALGQDRSNPAWQRIIAGSKTTGILTPSTAYIVVENQSQWETLKSAEEKSLDAAEHMALMDSPEPGLGILAALFFAWLWMWRRKTKMTPATCGVGAP